jgi:hypothetical protein
MARRLDKAEKALVSSNKVGETLNLKKAVCREFDVNDIYKFIRSSGFIAMSWSLNSPMIAIKNKALRFTVQGHHHKGYVYIVLGFLDLFDIYYTTNQDTIVKVATEVYIEDFIERLDADIEKVAEYVR